MNNKKKLSLSEILQLAEKIEDWEKGDYSSALCGGSFPPSKDCHVCLGSINNIEVEINKEDPTFLKFLKDRYTISAKYNKIDLGQYENIRDNKRMMNVYESISSKVKQKKHQERLKALNHARVLLK